MIGYICGWVVPIDSIESQEEGLAVSVASLASFARLVKGRATVVYWASHLWTSVPKLLRSEIEKSCGRVTTCLVPGVEERQKQT